MLLTVLGNVVLVGLGSLISGSTADELVRPLGFVRSLSDLLVGLSLIRVICKNQLDKRPNTGGCGTRHTVEPTHCE